MQTLALADELGLTLRGRAAGARPGAPDVTLTLDTAALQEPGDELGDAADIPADERNLAWRAARAWLEATGRLPSHGVDVHLAKRIPAGGGLGGGSSDAAAVLTGLSRLAGEPVPAGLAAALGSDVPFFLVGGTALCTGRGERVTPLPPPPPFRVTLLLPGLAVSTPAVYAALDAQPAPSAPADDPALAAEWAARLERAGPDDLQRLFRNDLAAAAARVAPALAPLLARPDLHLCGSGAALFRFGPPDAALQAAATAAGGPRGALRCIRFVTSLSRNR
jgi:4-diphosphocytidyl-2-C-methyl-D-erythritol kinase